MSKKYIFSFLILYASLVSCESPEEYAQSRSQLPLSRHYFSHILQLEAGQLELVLTPPAPPSRTLKGLTVALHYKINHGEIMTTFMTPKVPTWNFRASLGPLGPRDQLNYYFSYIYHPERQAVPLSVDSAWFHHRTPMARLHRNQINLQCQVLGEQINTAEKKQPSSIYRCHSGV